MSLRTPFTSTLRRGTRASALHQPSRATAAALANEHEPAPSSQSTGSPPRQQHEAPPGPTRYGYFVPYNTRWSDNDVYAHMNNAQYGHYFDAVTNHFLINQVGLVLPSGTGTTPTASDLTRHNTNTRRTPIGLAISSQTTFASSLAYPEPLIAALGIQAIGRSSVTWDVALFAARYVPTTTATARSSSSSSSSSVPPEHEPEHESIVQHGATVLRANPLTYPHVKHPNDLDNPLNHYDLPTISMSLTFAPPPPNSQRQGQGQGQEQGHGRGWGSAKAAAWGSLKHVFVDPDTRKSVELPRRMRDACERLMWVGKNGQGQGQGKT